MSSHEYVSSPPDGRWCPFTPQSWDTFVQQQHDEMAPGEEERLLMEAAEITALQVEEQNRFAVEREESEAAMENEGGLSPPVCEHESP